MISITSRYPVVAQADTRQGGRAENQDTCAWNDTPIGFLLTVCDGMGGGPSGKTASMIAADTISRSLMACEPGCDRVEAVRAAVTNANLAIFAAIDTDPSLKGMGTTATVLLIDEHSAVIAHVGDSRVYQFRGGKKIFRTTDHSWVFELVRQGSLTEEQARLSSQSNIITRALGHPNFEVDVVERPYLKGDRFMLCSDGIWGMFPEPEIVRDAAKIKSLPGAVESIVIRVDEEGYKTGGTHDNLTIGLAETTTESKLKEKMNKRTRFLLLMLAALLVVSLAANVAQMLLKPAAPEQPTPPVSEVNVDSLATVAANERIAKFEKEQMTGYRQTVDSILSLLNAKQYSEAEQLLNQEKERLNK